MSVRTFRARALEELFVTGATKRIAKPQWRKIVLILDSLDGITDLTDCSGVMDFHPLKGNRIGAYAMTVTANWRITFRWNGEEVVDVDYKDYH